MPFGWELQYIGKTRKSSYCLYQCVMLLSHEWEGLVCTAINFLLLSIATRPNSCKINPGINTVSEVASTSDFVLPCVRSSPTMVYKPFQSVLPALRCSCGSWKWIPIHWTAQSEKLYVLRQLDDAEHPCKRCPSKSKMYCESGWGASSVLRQSTELRMKQFKQSFLSSAHLCSCCC